MTATLMISAAVCVGIFLSVLFCPAVAFGKRGGGRAVTVGTYWLISALGAALLIVTGAIGGKEVLSGLTAKGAINPLKILALFLSMTALSVFLDETGFFRFLAVKALSRAGGSQKRTFFIVYLLVSVLTVFTSNDVVVLTFTPFLCYFAKRANVDPVPYLVGEFVAANSFSITLLIGNPTNIYLATACGVNFGAYFRLMWLPALFAGAGGLLFTYLLFHKKLAEPFSSHEEEVVETQKPLLVFGVIALAVCTVMIAVCSFSGKEMWAISLGFALITLLFGAVYSLIKKRKPTEVLHTLKRAPWELVPFVLSMFVVVLALTKHGVTERLAGALFAGKGTVLSFGVASFLAANLVNNIPMSVLFSSVATSLAAQQLPAVLATVVASNVGAYFTPVGALAGIMWLGLLKKQQVPFGFREFIRCGVCIALPTLLLSLGGLYLALALFA